MTRDETTTVPIPWVEVEHTSVRDLQDGFRTLTHPTGVRLGTSRIMPWVLMAPTGYTLRTCDWKLDRALVQADAFVAGLLELAAVPV